MSILRRNRVKRFGKARLGMLRKILPPLYSVDVTLPIKAETDTMSKDRSRIDSLLEEKIDQGVITAMNSDVIIEAYRALMAKNAAERELAAAEVSASAAVLAVAAHTQAREEESLVEASCGEAPYKGAEEA